MAALPRGCEQEGASKSEVLVPAIERQVEFVELRLGAEGSVSRFVAVAPGVVFGTKQEERVGDVEVAVVGQLDFVNLGGTPGPVKLWQRRRLLLAWRSRLFGTGRDHFGEGTCPQGSEKQKGDQQGFPGHGLFFAIHPGVPCPGGCRQSCE